MNKKKFIICSLTGACAFLVSICVISNQKSQIENFNAKNCEHKHVEKYSGVAPTLTSNGIMKHYACCDCHTAWLDENKTIVIGNTVSDRSKIDIYQKTQYTVIDKSDISNDDILLLRNDKPYVVGLDQTNWSQSLDGKGDGSFEYVNIDDRKAVRISAENLTTSQRSMLDASYSGYSSWVFNKKLSGKIEVSFDYKNYDLDCSSFMSEARTHAVFIGNKTIGQEYNLTNDNLWHHYSFTLSESINLTNLAFKVHHFTGEIFISNLHINALVLNPFTIEKNLKTIEFLPVENADYYIVHDDNHNEDEIRIESTDIGSDGKFHYSPFVVGEHSIYVTAHDEDGLYSSSSSNTINSISVDPVFFYEQIANEYYIPDTYEGPTPDLPTDYKNTFDYWGNSYHAYQTVNGTLMGGTDGFINRLDFTNLDLLDSIICNAIELGCNIICLNDFGDGCLRLNDGDPSHEFINTPLKRIMDRVWQYNLKVICYDQTIHHKAMDELNETISRQIVFDHFLDEKYGLPLIQHKAFYGLTTTDEPNKDNVVHSGNVVRYCNEFFSEYYVSKSLAVKKPFVLASLLPFNTSVFNDEGDYKQYLRDWLNSSQSDYLVFDAYTYTTSSYKQNRYFTDEIIDLQYTILSELKCEAGYSNLKVHQVTTSNNDKDARSPFTVDDVFGSTLLAAAFNNFGISRFTYFPASFTYHWNNSVVGRDGGKKAGYYWIKEAQKQFNFINNLLEGFTVSSVKFNTNGSYDDYSTTRTAIIKLTNGINNYVAYLNYDSNPYNYYNNIGTTIPNDRVYYKFGENQDLLKHIGSNNYVTAYKGEMILLLDEENGPRDITLDAAFIAGSFGKKGTSDLVGFDYFVENNVLNLVATDGSNPFVWLNQNCYESNSSLIDVAKASTSFTIRCKTDAGSKYEYLLTDYVKGRETEYIAYRPDINDASGDWDDVTFTGYPNNIDSLALNFFLGCASVGKTLLIESFTFHEVSAPLFIFEDLEIYDHRTISDVYGRSEVVCDYTNPDFERDKSFYPSMSNITRSYSFDFNVKLSNTKNSIFFFTQGNTGWSGIELVILSGGTIQLYLPSPGRAQNGFYELEGSESFDKEYNINFGVIRTKSSNKLYLFVKVNGVYWIRWAIDDSNEYSSSHIGFYNYASVDNNTIMKISDFKY